MTYRFHRRYGVPLALVILAAAVTSGNQADACSCIREGGWDGFLLSQDQDLPANARGLLWYTTRSQLDKGDFEVTRIDPGGDVAVPFNLVPLKKSRFDRSSNLHLIEFASPPQVGARYRFRGRHIQRSPGGPEKQERVVRVSSESIALEGSAILLQVESAQQQRLSVQAMFGRCSNEIAAATGQVRVKLSPGLDRFREHFIYLTLVDGKVWRPLPSTCSDIIPGGRTWQPVGTDLVFASCTGDWRSAATSLDPGKHEVRIKVWFPGRSSPRSVTTLPVILDLRCSKTTGD